MMTPIRCMISLGEEMAKFFRKKDVINHKKAKLIVNTGQLLLTQVKMLLDKSLIEIDQISPHLEKGYLLQIIGGITEIL
jgi:hypothetical protein